MNKISFKISREMLMELVSLQSLDEALEYIEDCFAIDKNRIESIQTMSEPTMDPALQITIKPKLNND
jgi:NifU-like protein involved in Fe-S cluster formation